MQLDAYTVLVAGCAAVLPFGFQFIFFWLRERSAPWLGWWALIFLSGAISIILLVPRGRVPDLLTVGIGNVAMFVAYGSAWVALRVFEHRKPLFGVVFSTCIAWLLLCFWPFFMDSAITRVNVASLIVGGFALAGARELWLGRSEKLPSRWPIIWLFLSFGLFCLQRLISGPFLPFPLGALPMQATSLGLFGIIVFAHATAIAMLMVSMTKERLELQQRRHALHDPLTGVSNRRAFLDLAGRLTRRRRFAREPLVILVLDLDHFKQINDEYGHAIGDRMLIGFAETAQASIRPTDYLFRMGGEEFCCILPDTTLQQGYQVAERIRLAFSHYSVDHGAQPVCCTVSIGVASSENMGHDIEAMHASADAAAYSAKARGRNRTVIAGSVLGMLPLFGNGKAAAVAGSV